MQKVLVIGGGIAGLRAAITLKQRGMEPLIVEKSSHNGGRLVHWDRLFPTSTPAAEVLASVLHEADDIESRYDTPIVSLEPSSDGVVAISESGERFEATAAVVATGFDLFDARLKEEYGYGMYDNVITSADLEAMFASGRGVRCVDGRAPRKIAILHCVGSRDEKVGQNHCSRLCCITGVKQAMELREALPECSVTNFYMDLRTFGPGYEELYRRSQVESKVTYIRGRISEAGETIDKQIQLKVEDTLVGRPLRLTVDMLVLLVGMTAPSCCAGFGLPVQESGFFAPADPFTESIGSSLSERIVFAGTATGPKNIAETLNEATAAACRIATVLGA